MSGTLNAFSVRFYDACNYERYSHKEDSDSVEKLRYKLDSSF